MDTWYKSLPIVTKFWLTGCVAVTLLVQIGTISTTLLYLNYKAVFDQYQLWRIVTNFFYFGKLDINLFFHLYFLVRYSTSLEDGSFRGRAADYLYMLIIGSIILMATNFGFYVYYTSFHKLFLASSLTMMTVYVWGRRNPHTVVNILGVFPFSAPYLSYVLLGLSVLLGGFSIEDDIMGIIAGHIYFFFEDVYPKMRPGRRLFKTPALFKTLFEAIPLADLGPNEFDNIPDQDAPAANDDQANQMAF